MKANHNPGIHIRQWDDDPAVSEAIKPGDFEITTDAGTGQRWFWFKCPGPCGAVAPLALRPVTPMYASRPSWEYNDDITAPTLKPSINHVGCWHGWLTNGEFA